MSARAAIWALAAALWAVGAAGGAGAGETGAAAPFLGWPLDCELGTSCFVQNHVDRDPGPGAADFTCGPLSYDGHKGTDIALVSRRAMEAGVEVRAAAPGVVRAMRDGEPDDATSRPGKECGNGVLVAHADGWESQYCHMKRGSIAVAPGQRVTRGQRLGEVGLSGKTSFAHLHFQLRHQGQIVDPYAAGSARCGEAGGTGALWLAPVPYLPGGLVSTGVALGIPDFSDIKAGRAAVSRADGTAPALAVWAQAFGARAGDVLRLELEAPDGRVVASRDFEITRPWARLFRATGLRRPPGGWSPGIWRGTSLLLRDGKPVGQAQEARIEISP